MRLVNLTPHPVVIVGLSGERIEIAPEPEPARLEEFEEERPSILVDGAPVRAVAKWMGELEGLPEPQPGTLYIVSMLAAQRAWEMGRHDVVAPTGFIRENGVPVAATALAVNPAAPPAQPDWPVFELLAGPDAAPMAVQAIMAARLG